MAQRKKIVIASFGNDPKPRDICNVLRHKCYSSRVYMYVRPVRIARFARFCAVCPCQLI